ncbi:lipocalin family protein [bacterium]|nr:lipocalin family protein [bacterium]
MPRRVLLLASFALLCCLACSDSGPADPSVPELVGAWLPASDGWDDGVQTYQRAGSLSGQTPGIEFRRDGTAAERTAGWCGTPPLSYVNVEGTWSVESDAVVLTDIDLGWMSPVSRWEIVELTDTQLRVRRTRLDEEP